MNKDRPILFSGPMVRALLDGSKTQTRRICKANFISSGGALMQFTDDDIKAVTCPYAKEPGDRLWVREAWRTVEAADNLPPRDLHAAYRIWYEADNPQQPAGGKLRPSMFMPRWASRITLEIVSVRVERLQDISEADAIAEGIERDGEQDLPSMEAFVELWRNYKTGGTTISPVYSYETLWEQINGPGSWEANPFVWCVNFKRIESA